MGRRVARERSRAVRGDRMPLDSGANHVPADHVQGMRAPQPSAVDVTSNRFSVTSRPRIAASAARSGRGGALGRPGHLDWVTDDPGPRPPQRTLLTPSPREAGEGRGRVCHSGAQVKRLRREAHTTSIGVTIPAACSSSSTMMRWMARLAISKRRCRWIIGVKRDDVGFIRSPTVASPRIHCAGSGLAGRAGHAHHVPCVARQALS